MTGACKDKASIPYDYISDGPVASQVGVGYLDGKKPSLVAVVKNRQKNKNFNMMIASYSYTNGEFKMDWKWNRGYGNYAYGHNFRIIDVDDDVMMGYGIQQDNPSGLLEYYYNAGKIEEWDYTTKSIKRLLSCYKVHSTVNDSNFVIGYGDIFGDWREEIICSNATYNELVIYTTNIETQYRIPCLVQDRACT